jgi:hypothetical protein
MPMPGRPLIRVYAGDLLDMWSMSGPAVSCLVDDRQATLPATQRQGLDAPAAVNRQRRYSRRRIWPLPLPYWQVPVGNSVLGPVCHDKRADQPKRDSSGSKHISPNIMVRPDMPQGGRVAVGDRSSVDPIVACRPPSSRLRNLLGLMCLHINSTAVTNPVPGPST